MNQLQLVSPSLSCSIVFFPSLARFWHSSLFLLLLIFLCGLPEWHYYHYDSPSELLTLAPMFSRTLLSILFDLNNAIVLMVSTRPLILNTSDLFPKTLGTVPSALITIGTTVTLIFRCSLIFLFNFNELFACCWIVSNISIQGGTIKLSP